MKQIILIGLVFLILASFTSATCTVEWGQDNYTVGETTTLTMICDAPADQSVPYSLNISNSSNGGRL